jgi:hypothetical protein
MSNFSAWYYGPGGEAAIFTDAGRIPAGWRDRPFVADPDPLDHDADGRRGGSLSRQGHEARLIPVGRYEIVDPGGAVVAIVKGKKERDALLAELERKES